jgi:hypothetical protein
MARFEVLSKNLHEPTRESEHNMQPLFRPRFEIRTHQTRSYYNVNLGLQTIFYFNYMIKFETVHPNIITPSKLQLLYIKIMMMMTTISLEKTDGLLILVY